MPDNWEIQNGLNPNDPNDANLDPDNDGLKNYEEYNVQTLYSKPANPNKQDTDDDSFSDKKELDKKTSPVDASSFPKSNLTKIMLFILGVLVLIAGFGFLAYKIVPRKKEEEFELPKQKPVTETPIRVVLQRPPQPPQQLQTKKIPIQPIEQETGFREELIRREEEKGRERRKLFTAFGKVEEPQKEIKEEKKQTNKIKKQKNKLGKILKEDKLKEVVKDEKDVLYKLKEIVKEETKK
jgi:hypothetical protein